MSKLIEIKIANPNAIKITFVMTKSCTYKCRYCPEELNAGKHKVIDIVALEEFLKKFKDRDKVLQLTGGECTTHPQFKEIITLAKRIGYKVLVDSNSVRTEQFYEETAGLVDNWCITLHPSQHKLNLEKLKILSENSFLVVYVMMDPLYWETSLEWLEVIGNLNRVKVTPIKMLDNFSGANFVAEYTEEQLKILSSLTSKLNFTEEQKKELNKSHSFLLDSLSYAFYDDNTSSLLDPFELIRNEKNKFTGWLCNGGNQSITIYDDGSASWASCGLKTYKNYLDINIDELKQGLICTNQWCVCGTDIRTSKKIYDNI